MKKNQSWSYSYLINILISIFIAIQCTSLTNKRNLISTDNICTFHIADKLFSLLYLQNTSPYVIDISPNQKIYYDFCHSFIPSECQNASITSNNDTQLLYDGFAFLVTKKTTNGTAKNTNSSSQTINNTTNLTNNTSNDTIQNEINSTTTGNSTARTIYTCQRYTSNSYIYNFNTDYIKHNDQPQLVMNLSTADRARSTELHVFCSGEDYFRLRSYAFANSNQTIKIIGESLYGCPVFQISSLWTALQDNSFILGIILFVLGFQLLFYGLLMINVTVFIAGYFISFAVIGGIFTVLLGPDSSSIAVYFALLFILLASTLIAYGLTKLINVSIFFIGAFFGLILGALVNTLFISMFSVESVWSLVIFQVLFTIPFGLLTFKYSNQVIILSTSLTGSYLIIRPISWIFGGFPNEFTLYQMFQSGQISQVPWTFYIYLLFIIVHAIMGGLYQFLKLQRSDPNNTITTNIVTDSIQQPLDKIRNAVQRLVQRYSSSQQGQQNYKLMKQKQYESDYIEDKKQYTQYGSIQSAKNPLKEQSYLRNSKQNKNGKVSETKNSKQNDKNKILKQEHEQQGDKASKNNVQSGKNGKNLINNELFDQKQDTKPRKSNKSKKDDEDYY